MSDNSSAALYAEREGRIRDNIALRPTDRVPFTYNPTFWAARLAGMTYQDLWYDVDKCIDATRQAIRLLEPDSYSTFTTAFGPTLEALDWQPMKWPGHGVDENATFQYLDAEHMSAEEYDLYLADPTRFYLSTYLPRVSGAFAAFDRFPALPTTTEWSLIKSIRAFADPELQAGLKQLIDAGEKMDTVVKKMNIFIAEMTAEGYPLNTGALAQAPYDMFVDFFRGSKSGMLDMFRNKDKMLAATAKARDFMLENAIKEAREANCPYVLIPLHWGLDGFMSLDQFKVFYWPDLRKMIIELINNELTPVIKWEGDSTSRLETIGDIPAGKAVYWFELTDLVTAKEMIGDTVCLRGNVPASILNTATPDDVDEYCKNIINKVGKGGGLILDGAIGVPDEARIENVVAMAQSVKKNAF